MPFRSPKQRRFFEAIAHGMKPKKKGAPSKAVAKQFIKDADDGGKQLDNSPVILGKKPLAQARKRVRKTR